MIEGYKKHMLVDTMIAYCLMAQVSVTFKPVAVPPHNSGVFKSHTGAFELTLKGPDITVIDTAVGPYWSREAMHKCIQEYNRKWKEIHHQPKAGVRVIKS